ncbi:hypothetical protein BZG01_11905 [Labilibaculum manganireducens]|uniref:Uncharacterized protein n=1 Tax=Labilibaculum manganireducens TaxID=1940525 RepID=A0A2N3I7L5_9BACT|nr:hypothetical protein BZG01_11905 [Labilibaculum manganireducens]
MLQVQITIQDEVIFFSLSGDPEIWDEGQRGVFILPQTPKGAYLNVAENSNRSEKSPLGDLGVNKENLRASLKVRLSVIDLNN